MSDLTPVEKRKLERALGMGSGFVLDFSNRTFDEFFSDYFSIDIYDAKYNYARGPRSRWPVPAWATALSQSPLTSMATFSKARTEQPRISSTSPSPKPSKRSRP